MNLAGEISLVKAEITKNIFGVYIAKYSECPFCNSKDIFHDPKIKVYICSNCGKAWK